MLIPTDSSENKEMIFSDFAPWNKINEKIPRPWQKEYTIRLYMKLKGYQEFHFDSALEDSGTDIGYLDSIFFKGIYLYIYRCNDGHPDDNFDDLVFEIFIENL